MKLKNWLNIWLNDAVKPTLKERTYARYEKIVDGQITPRIGDEDLDSLTPVKLQGFVSGLFNGGNTRTGGALAASTVNAVITVLQSSLKTAVSFGELNDYSGNKIRRPKTDEGEISCFTLKEQRKIESYVLNSKKAKLYGIIVCLYTGLRVGELLALEWEDINFSAGTLSVNKTCYYLKGQSGVYGRHTGTPKTAKSKRQIPLPPQIITKLKALKKQSQSKYVVANGANPVDVRSYQRSFALLLNRLEIPHRSFHALRHTFATRAVECGMDVKTLAEIMGHKDAKVTLEKYVRSLTEHKKEMMKRLGKLLE